MKNRQLKLNTEYWVKIRGETNRLLKELAKKEVSNETIVEGLRWALKNINSEALRRWHICRDYRTFEEWKADP